MQKEMKRAIDSIMNENIKKPSTPLILDGQEELTQEEFEKRLFVEQQLSSVGISTTIFDGENIDYENPYILEAILLVNNGKEIPEDLKQKIRKITKVDLSQEWKLEKQILKTK